MTAGRRLRAGVPPSLVPLLMLSLLAPGAPAAADEARRVEAIVAQAVRANYEILHGCYRKQLARDRRRGGNLILRLTLGQVDAVRAVTLERDQLGNPEVAKCVLGWVRGWTLRGAGAAGVEPGSQLLVPLSFQPLPGQFAVHRDDVKELPLQGGSAARLLLGEKNAGARLASLSLLEVRGRLPLPTRGGAEQALYVLEGRGQLRGPAGGRRWPLREGDAVFLEAPVRAVAVGNLSLLQVVAPAADEGLYQDDQAQRSQAPAAATGSGGAVVVVAGARGRRKTAFGGALRLTPLLQSARLGHRRIYLGLLEARPGVELPSHEHASQAELVYLLRGQAQASCSGTTQTVGPGHALYLPPGLPHTARVEGKSARGEPALRAVQIFVPGGPEDR